MGWKMNLLAFAVTILVPVLLFVLSLLVEYK